MRSNRPPTIPEDSLIAECLASSPRPRRVGRAGRRNPHRDVRIPQNAAPKEAAEPPTKRRSGEGGAGSRRFGITADLPEPDDFFRQDGWLARVELDCMADSVLTRLDDELTTHRARHAAMLVGAMATSAGHETGAGGRASTEHAILVQGPPHADPQWPAELGGILVLSCQHSRCMGL